MCPWLLPVFRFLKEKHKDESHLMRIKENLQRMSRPQVKLQNVSSARLVTLAQHLRSECLALTFTTQRQSFTGDAAEKCFPAESPQKGR